MTGRSYRLGVDLGGTKIEVVGLTSEDVELGRMRVETPAGRYGATIDAVVRLISRAEAAWGRARSIGVGTPGAVDPHTGLLKNSNSIVLNGRPLARDLMEASGRDMRFANDANCLALSEVRDGTAAGADPVFAVILGTGVGGGLVAGGRLVEGANASAGEWGHTRYPDAAHDPLNPGPCWCGLTDCIETYLSGSGLSREFARRTGRTLGASRVAGLAGSGDAEAAGSIEAYCRRLGRALAVVANVLDPEVIVLGGGLSNIALIFDRVPAVMAEALFGPRTPPRLVPAAHGDSSGARGAARLWD